MIWDQWLLSLLSGVGVGSMYGLTALGFHITFRVSRTVNFAQGTCLMLAAVAAFTMQVSWQWPVWLSIMLSLLLCAGWGAGVEFFAVRPFTKKGSDAWLMSTLALGLLLENVVLLSFGKDPRGMPSALQNTVWLVEGIPIGAQQVLIPLVGFVLAAALSWMFQSTPIGRAWTAISLNPEAASLMGIPRQRFITLSFALSGLLAGIAGLLIAPLYTVSAGMGTLFGLKAFAAAIVGGMDSALGVMLAGTAMGLLEAWSISALGSTYTQMISFGITIVILCIKPQGLLGRPEVKKV
jgi:branched-chain amino acid transport system permease protein